jgi:hypothetical protein
MKLQIYNTFERLKLAEAENLILLVRIYNYHPCWSVTWRFVSQRKVKSLSVT